MNLPSSTPYFQQLTDAQKFVVEFWYGQTHSASLDSYRVRLHNGRTILKEVFHEIEVGLVEGPEMQVLAAEAFEVCGDDEAVLACLGGAWKVLASALEEVSTKKEVKEAKKTVMELECVQQLRFALADTLPKVERAYRPKLFLLIRNHLSNDADPFANLRGVTASLLSDLVDTGWTLESLHEWASNLGGQGGPRKNTFEQRFSFMERQIMREPQPFTVCLRLGGSPVLAQLGTFKGWTFAATAPSIVAPPREVEFYLRTNPQTAFATYQVQAIDFKSALHSALEVFEECLDRLRFNFLDATVHIDPRLLIIRGGDQKTRLEKITFPVPNPVFTTDLNQFRRSSERIDDLLRKDTLDRTSRERIASAARHYRLGQDSESYRDKLLNWWFGLEYLTKVTNQGSIGSTVTARARDCMSARYIQLLLLDLEPSLRENLAAWPASVKNLIGCGDGDILTSEKLLRLMQDHSCRADVSAGVAARPWLKIRFLELADCVSDAAKLEKFTKDHARRVERQLKRLYRVRCCLVHGSRIVLRLMLLCANLEFYLRESIVLMLRTLLHNSQVVSLNEFYRRLTFALKRREALLKATGAARSPDSATMFDGIVISTD